MDYLRIPRIYSAGVSSASVPITHAPRFDDVQGILNTSLTGANKWTYRQYRNTGLVVPFLADGDFFTQIVQMPHRKKLGTNVGSFHIHWITTAAATGTVIWDYAWGFYNENGTTPIPDTLPNTGSTTWNITAADRYLPKVMTIIPDIPPPAEEGYSAILLVKVQRNGGTWGNSNEIGIRYVDCHVEVDRFGSVGQFSDTP